LMFYSCFSFYDRPPVSKLHSGELDVLSLLIFRIV
jgi:hypothetical protein